MDNRRTQPIGIELVKRRIVKEEDINRALDYQKEHPSKKVGDILYELHIGNPNALIAAIADILGEKPMLLGSADIKINIADYLPLDIARKNKAIPFETGAGKIKVCFSNTANQRMLENMRLLFLNKGLIMERYITFDSIIDEILTSMEIASTETIDVNADISELVNSIIKNGMEKRASDIHIEPEENSIRVRYRIDGELVTAATIEKDKQAQLIGRLKAISNMHQEKQESQDGRILLYSDYNIRVSSQKNIYGEKFVLRMLKKTESIKNIFELGFPYGEKELNRAVNKKNSLTIMAAPTGEGKTTTLYSILDYLKSDDINITTIEDPVEIRIPGLNQIEVDKNTRFADSLRTILRQDPDVVLVGEIRDKETAEIAIEAGQTGHYVLSTIHTIDAIEVVTRLRKMGLSDYDIASTVGTTISQRLLRKICPHCKREREFTDYEKEVIQKIGEKYDYNFNLDGVKTYDAVRM